MPSLTDVVLLVGLLMLAVYCLHVEYWCRAMTRDILALGREVNTLNRVLRDTLTLMEKDDAN